MKKTLMIAALMMGSTAIAQTAQPSGQTVDDPSQATGPAGVTQQNTDPNGQATAPSGYNQGTTQMPTDTGTQSGMNHSGMNHSGMNHSQGAMSQGNTGTMSQGNMSQSGAMSQTGYTGRGGPEAGGTYPACSRTVTDSCVQTYERGVRARSRR